MREHRWVAREVEDQDSGNLTLNHLSVELVPPTIDSVETSTMILLCEHPRPVRDAMAHPKMNPLAEGADTNVGKRRPSTGEGR